MKKLFLILTFLISSIFFISNVNAEIYHYDFENNLCDETGNNCFNEKNTITYENNSITSGTKSLFLNNPSYSSKVNAINMSNKNLFNSNYFHINFDFYALENMPNLARFLLFPYIYGNPQIYLKNDDVCHIFGTEKQNCYSRGEWNNVDVVFENMTLHIKITSPTHGENYYIHNASSSSISTFYLGYYTDSTAGFHGYIDNMYILTNANDVVPNNKIPSIDISKEHETSVTILEKEYVTDVTLNVKFSSINNDKYLYQYKFIGENEGLWTTKTLENDNFSVKFNENGTLVVRIVDKETSEDVTSAVYTIGSINYDLTPYIEAEFVETDGCLLENYTICKALRINSHIADFNRYRFIIIDHGQNITEEYKEMTIWKTYYMNTSLEIRIVDRTTGKYVDVKDITITSISEETENLGQYITQDCKFASIGYNYLCDYYFYNYDPDQYSYYYGSSTTIFEELKLETGLESAFTKTIYKVRNGLGRLKEVSYSENTTVYFEIKDKETNEVVYTKTFRVNYDKQFEESGKKNLFDIFKNFRDENSSIKKLLEDMWNSIKNSSIYEYIFILVVGTLIVLIIKASNR